MINSRTGPAPSRGLVREVQVYFFERAFYFKVEGLPVYAETERVNHLQRLLIISLSVFLATSVWAQNTPVPEVEWYAPEIERTAQADRALVIISGRTLRGSMVSIDGDTITLLKAPPAPSRRPPRPKPDFKFESHQTRANAEGFFEISMELPKGLTQMAVQVATPAKSQKTFLLSVDVNPAKEDIQLGNTKVSKAKPPAAAKRIRLWAGAGFTYQSFGQTTLGTTDLNFQTVQAPGFVLRGGYWGEDFGLDLYFRDAPGTMAAEAPLSLQTDNYHWQTIEVKGLYQLPRGPSSRLLGLPSQWQVRFGAQFHQVPFMEISNTNVISVQDNNLTMGMLGLGLLLGQEQEWTYEFAAGLQTPLSSSSNQGKSFAASSAFGYEFQLGAAYKFAPNWRLGLFSYTQSLLYSYDYQNLAGFTKTGKQSLFYTTLDLRLGYEF